jgi:hypothetical protein
MQVKIQANKNYSRERPAGYKPLLPSGQSSSSLFAHQETGSEKSRDRKQ